MQHWQGMFQKWNHLRPRTKSKMANTSTLKFLYKCCYFEINLKLHGLNWRNLYFSIRTSQFTSSMGSKYQASGEARKVVYENLYSKDFSKNGKDAFSLRLTLVDGKPKIGFSRFWHNFKDNEWYSFRDHLFLFTKRLGGLTGVLPNWCYRHCTTEPLRYADFLFLRVAKYI